MKNTGTLEHNSKCSNVPEILYIKLIINEYLPLEDYVSEARKAIAQFERGYGIQSNYKEKQSFQDKYKLIRKNEAL